MDEIVRFFIEMVMWFKAPYTALVIMTLWPLIDALFKKTLGTEKEKSEKFILIEIMSKRREYVKNTTSSGLLMTFILTTSFLFIDYVTNRERIKAIVIYALLTIIVTIIGYFIEKPIKIKTK